MSVGWQNSQSASMGRRGALGCSWGSWSPWLFLWVPLTFLFQEPHSAIGSWMCPFPPLTEGEVEGVET